MSRTARLLATAAISLALSGAASPLALAGTAYAATASAAQSGDVDGALDGIGWDGVTTAPATHADDLLDGIGWD
ncbi:hypothetical protein ACFXGI_06820 [Streptomyces sp. NPDC059355]|uniref:hypothetical protein n=1 Tax=Streptomyces sp. NPDC059355 TaxID=3346811 RepID=UPI00369CA039